jgi:hypothetical protein
MSLIEKMFLDDVRNKKRTASGVHHKTGKRGYTGKILFPTDFMTRKEKYNTRKAGKVVITNMYDNIMNYTEFKQLPLEEQKKTMLEYRKKHTNESIRKQWNLSTYEYFTKLLKKELGIITGSSKASSPKKEKVLQVSPAPVPAIAEPPAEAETFEGFSFTLKGSFSAETLLKRLEKLTLLLDEETNDFHINLEIKEISKN